MDELEIVNKPEGGARVTAKKWLDAEGQCLPMSHEPRLVNILCQWCSYSAADLAGSSRLQVPANVRVMRVMCTGRIDQLC